MQLALLLVAAYLLGSVPFAVVVSRLFGMADPRSYGSGNPGATNVLRSGNKLAAVLTLNPDRLIDQRKLTRLEANIQYGTDDLCDLSCTIICHVISSCFLYRVHHFRASAPEMISVNSCVIAPCLARLYASSKFEIISSALLVAESIACILAPFSLATDVTKAP